jgi:hypothetical protein
LEIILFSFSSILLPIKNILGFFLLLSLIEEIQPSTLLKESLLVTSKNNKTPSAFLT